jgi:hypothetical protein
VKKNEELDSAEVVSKIKPGMTILDLTSTIVDHTNEYSRYLNSITRHIIETRDEREYIHNLERKYHQEKILSHNKHKKYTWIDGGNTEILRWRGFIVGGVDNRGHIITNQFDLNSLYDDYFGVFFILSYIYNPLLMLIGIQNTVFNEKKCCPIPPKLPDPRYGCTYPRFVVIITRNGIFNILPDGFDLNNPKCDAYSTFGGWSLGISRVAGTLIFGRVQYYRPRFTRLLGIDFFIANETGRPGLAALPPNMLPCLAVFVIWANLFFAVFIGSILIIVFAFIFYFRFIMKYRNALEKREEEEKLDLIDREHFKAEEIKEEIKNEINRKTEETFTLMIMMNKFYFIDLLWIIKIYLFKNMFQTTFTITFTKF